MAEAIERVERKSDEMVWYDDQGVKRRRDNATGTWFYNSDGNLIGQYDSNSLQFNHTDGTTSLVSLSKNGLTIQLSDGSKKITLDTAFLQMFINGIAKVALQAGRLGLSDPSADAKKVDINAADVNGTASFKATGVCDAAGTSAKILRGDPS
jgi:hypothetical protein